MKKMIFLPPFFIPALLIAFLLIPGGCRTRKEKTNEPASTAPSAITAADLTDQLLEAAMNGDMDKVKRLVGDGLDVNIRGEGERTALMMASYNGHTDIVKYLLSKGAKVNLVDEMGRPALIYAASGTFP